jgi:hypothetical protein
MELRIDVGVFGGVEDESRRDDTSCFGLGGYLAGVTYSRLVVCFVDPADVGVEGTYWYIAKVQSWAGPPALLVSSIIR